MIETSFDRTRWFARACIGPDNLHVSRSPGWIRISWFSYSKPMHITRSCDRTLLLIDHVIGPGFWLAGWLVASRLIGPAPPIITLQAGRLTGERLVIQTWQCEATLRIYAMRRPPDNTLLFRNLSNIFIYFKNLNDSRVYLRSRNTRWHHVVITDSSAPSCVRFVMASWILNIW